MKSMLLAAATVIAATVLTASPAQARNFRGSSVTTGQAPGQPSFACENLRDRRSRAVCDSATVVYGGEWALYNNRSWEPDSYNDWWHDRPDRAYPAWMRHNQDCQRMWFTGDTLRC